VAAGVSEDAERAATRRAEPRQEAGQEGDEEESNKEMTFRGWPVEALEFWDKLDANNTRAWWLENKPIYDEAVKAPFLELSKLVEKEFGPLHLFRPNRDTRFSKDKTPYKINAGARTEGEGGAAYYVALSTEGLYAGSGYYHLAPDQLERYRRAVADNKTGPKFAAAVTTVGKKLTIANRDALKRVPRGFDADHPRAELLKWKGVHAGKEFGAPKWMHTKAAYDRIVAAWREAKPLLPWLDKNVGPSSEAPSEPS
jgi:uncharacterized protein (TIGR02453 family)